MADIKTAYNTMTSEINLAMKKENEERKECLIKSLTDIGWEVNRGTDMVKGLPDIAEAVDCALKELTKENDELKKKNHDLETDAEQLLEVCEVDFPEEAWYYISELKKENEDFKNGGVFKDLTEKIDTSETLSVSAMKNDFRIKKENEELKKESEELKKVISDRDYEIHHKNKLFEKWGAENMELKKENEKLKEEKKKIGMEHAVIADVVWNSTRDGDDCTEAMKKELIETGGMGEWWEDEDE
jgi:outer membrane protein assembly factor BamE (lipoprotein component of BamABCDE complex)